MLRFYKAVALASCLITVQIPLALGQSYVQNILDAKDTLMDWYDTTTGLWDTTGWWNSANLVETLADLAAVHSEAEGELDEVFNNTFVMAQHQNTKKLAIRSHMVRATFQPTGFLNEFYDDGGWWALAWIKVYDVTGEERYLDTATTIFDDMVATGYNATCGGLWWKRDKRSNNAIENELFLSIAAHLANRKPNGYYYRDWALRHWKWFESTGLINDDWLINDGLNITTCKNNGATVFSYNQGVILGGLVELNKAAPNDTLLDIANNIAHAAIDELADDNDILHDACEGRRGDGDCVTFKGPFMRNLAVLMDATDDSDYVDFVKTNADSIWAHNRNDTNDQLGPVWTGPFNSTLVTAASQGAALDALVAAATV